MLERKEHKEWTGSECPPLRGKVRVARAGPKGVGEGSVVAFLAAYQAVGRQVDGRL